MTGHGRLKMLLTLSCDRASALLSKAQEVPLDRTERWALRLHLLICRSCRRYRRQLDWLRQVFQRAAEGPESPIVPEESRRRVIQHLRDRLDSS